MVRRIPYSKSVFLLVLAGTVIPLLILSLVSTGMSASLVDSIVEDTVSDSLESIGLRLGKFTETSGRGLVKIAASLDTLRLLGEDDARRDRTAAAVEALALDQFKAEDPPVHVYLVSKAGETVYSNAAANGALGRDPASTAVLVAEVSKRPAGITLSARRRSLTGDPYVSFSMATAVIGPSGKPEGYVIADIPRETLRTVMAPIPKLPELFILDGDGYVAWSLSESDREGTPYEGQQGGRDPLRIEYRSGKLTLVAKKPAELVSDLVEKTAYITFACLAASLALAFAVAYLISRRISRPVTKLIEATRAVADGDLSVALAVEGTGDIARLMNDFNAMVGELKSLFDRTVEEQELLKRAELDSLGSQLNPHFFFNALSSIGALAKLGACKEINTVTVALSRLLRSSLDRSSEPGTVAGSLAETRNYLTIEKIRFADRFEWTEEVGAGLEDCEVPRLAVQTLVENALIHGIEPNPEPSLLRIRVVADQPAGGATTVDGAAGDTTAAGDAEEPALRIEVEDNGVGIGEERLARINEGLAARIGPSGDAHIGLLNANRRIALVYGERYGIRLRAREGGGIVSTMTIPMRRAERCTE